MKYNVVCTIWHKIGETWVTEYFSCWWEDTEANNITKSAKTDVDTAMALLPLSAEVSKGDYIIKGTVDFAVTESISELLSKVKPLKVSTVSKKEYGSELMRHTKVTAK